MISEEQINGLISVYSDLSQSQQASLLALLALNITVSARGAYPSQESEVDVSTVKPNLSDLIGYNEIQHTVTGQLAHMVDEDENRYPDDVFLRIMLEKAGHSQYCEEGLLWALKFSFNTLGISLSNL